MKFDWAGIHDRLEEQRHKAERGGHEEEHRDLCALLILVERTFRCVGCGSYDEHESDCMEVRAR